MRLPAALVLLGAGIGASCGGGAPGGTSPGGEAHVVDADGLAELLPPRAEGPVLVNYWAIWCAPCVAELPDLVEVARDGARVIAVSLDLPTSDAVPGDVARFVRENDLEDLVVPVLRGDLAEIAERFDLPGPIPYTVALDAQGEVADSQRGQASRERFEEMLRRAGG